MKLSSDDLEELAEVAIVAATEAGQMVAESRPVAVEHKAEAGSLASQVVTEIDRRSEAIILGHLAPTLASFELALLSEERDDDRARLHADHFWCIDPLDGTLPFIEGKPGYAVSIALVGRDGVPLIGVLYDVVAASLVHAISGAGAFRDRRPWHRDEGPGPGDGQQVLTVFTDRSAVDDDNYAVMISVLNGIAGELGLAGARVHTKAAVTNALGVLDNPPACYFKAPKASGGGSLWDFAATACVFAEVGAVATDSHGDPLDLNRADSTFMHHRGVLFATDESVAEQIRRRISEGTSDA